MRQTERVQFKHYLMPASVMNIKCIQASLELTQSGIHQVKIIRKFNKLIYSESSDDAENQSFWTVVLK